MSGRLRPDTLHTTEEHFEAIWRVLGRSQTITQKVSVPRAALMAVMMDHARFYREVFPTRGRQWARKGSLRKSERSVNKTATPTAVQGHRGA